MSPFATKTVLGTFRSVWLSKHRVAVSAHAVRVVALTLTDATALTASAGTSLIAQELLGYSDAENEPSLALSRYALIAMGATLLSLFTTLALRGRYTGRMPFWSELRLIFQTSLLGAGTILIFSLATHDLAACALFTGTLVTFPILATAANRYARSALARSGRYGVDVLLIGVPDETMALEAALRSDPLLGYNAVARIDPAAVIIGASGVPLRVLMRQYAARQAIATMGSDHALLRPLLNAARLERCAFACVPVAAILEGEGQTGVSFLSNDILLMHVHQGVLRSNDLLMKIGFDVAFTLILLLWLSPLFAIICGVNALMGGPVFFAHRRVGLDGRPFQCLKFRTMRVDGDSVLARHLASDPDAAHEWATTRKLACDPRVTPVGRLLRKTSLDELPQLINVLRLEMSLVGPRPIVQAEVPFYGDKIMHYTAMRPGLTGLWQVSGRSNTSFDRRVKLDTWYVRNWSFWSDIAVLLKTVPAVLRREGAQ